MNTIDPAQQTPLHQFAGTLSKWCRKAIVPRWTEREEGEQEEEFSFGIDESMWDKNSMWHLYEDNKVGEYEEWDEKAMLDIEVAGEQPREARSTTKATVDAFADKRAEWNDTDVVIDSAGFDEASFYSDEEVNFSGSEMMTRQGVWMDPSIDQILDITPASRPL